MAAKNAKAAKVILLELEINNVEEDIKKWLEGKKKELEHRGSTGNESPVAESKPVEHIVESKPEVSRPVIESKPEVESMPAEAVETEEPEPQEEAPKRVVKEENIESAGEIPQAETTVIEENERVTEEARQSRSELSTPKNVEDTGEPLQRKPSFGGLFIGMKGKIILAAIGSASAIAVFLIYKFFFMK